MAEMSEKLNKLEKSVCSDAEVIADEIIHHAQERKKEILDAAENEYLEEVFKSSQADIKRIKADYLKCMSHLKFDVKQEKFAFRTKLIEEMFSHLKEKLIAFSQTNEYANYLKTSVEKAQALQRMSQDTIVSVKHADIDREDLREMFGSRLIEDRTIEIGGITVFYPKENLFCDLTLDSALRREKEEFINTFNIQL